ncbi:hypothetical protein D3C76_968310 [compost metagenome]
MEPARLRSALRRRRQRRPLPEPRSRPGNPATATCRLPAAVRRAFRSCADAGYPGPAHHLPRPAGAGQRPPGAGSLPRPGWGYPRRASRAALAGAGPCSLGQPGVHLGDHRRAQGGDAQPRQPAGLGQRLQAATAWLCRTRLPADGPRRRTGDRPVPAPLVRRTGRLCARHQRSAQGAARDTAGLLRQCAAPLRKVAWCGHGSARSHAGRQAAPAGLGATHRHPPRAGTRRRPAAAAGAAAGAGQTAPAPVRRAHPRAGERRCAAGCEPGGLLRRPWLAAVRRLGHVRVHRLPHQQRGRATQGRFGRPRPARRGVAHRRRRRDPGARPAGVPGLLPAAGQNRRDLHG